LAVRYLLSDTIYTLQTSEWEAESQQPIAESQKCTQKNVPLQQNSTYDNLKALFLYTATVFVGSIGTKP
jgi:hypothetical protein